MFFTADKQPTHYEGQFKGQSVFMLFGGPSLSGFPLDKLNAPGVVTFGVNNSVKIFRPQMWTMVDDPANFMVSIWQDPKILKFVPDGKQKLSIFDNVHWRMTSQKVRDCPNIMYYKRNEMFNEKTFLTEPTVNWGMHTDHCECGYVRKDRAAEKVCPKCNTKRWGARSVMHSALRIVNILGFRKVFLLGCDFKMKLGGQNYAFDQDRSKGSVNNNNCTYERMNDRFARLRPYLEESGMYVYNCLKDSGLKAFDWMSFDLAHEIATHDFPDTKSERTAGMYDRKANEINDTPK